MPSRAPRHRDHRAGKRYRGQWALADCTLSIPAGHVVGLVGPNGAGKSTLLNLATGMLTPTAGTIEVLGGRPAAGPEQLARVGYLAQDAPVYAGLSVADHLRLGARLNPGWDHTLAQARAGRLELNPKQKAGTLSGGQRAQLALTLAIAKRPELLLLDEPAGSLDPLARREFLQDLMETVAEQEVSVVLSSHLISDLVRAGHDRERHHAGQVDPAGDQEDPAPAEGGGEQPADDRPDGAGGAVDRTPGAKRDAPVAALVAVADQRHRGSLPGPRAFPHDAGKPRAHRARAGGAISLCHFCHVGWVNAQ